MNLLQLRTLARHQLDDVTLPHRWSDDELDDYINRAAIEAVIRSRCLVDSTTPVCCTLQVTSGTATYALHPAIFQLRRVFDITHKKALKKTGAEDLDASNPDWQNKTANNATHFMDDLNHYGNDNAGNRTITLYPVPAQDAVLNLTVYRLPLQALVADADVPEIPAFYHRNLVYWVLSLAYMKQDADALDAGRSLQFENKFETCFGMKQDARKIEWRRKYKPVQTTGQYF